MQMMYCDQNTINATANLLAVYLERIGNVIGSDRLHILYTLLFIMLTDKLTCLVHCVWYVIVYVRYGMQKMDSLVV